MRPVTMLIITLSGGALAGCSDLVTHPVSPDGRGPMLTTAVNQCPRPYNGGARAASVAVASYGAVANDGGDDTCAIQNAVDAGSSVYFPTGDYNVSATIQLPSGTRMYGDGAASRIVSVAGVDVFASLGNSWAFVDNVTVENLGFHSADGGGYALHARTSRYVTFRGNTTTNIGLIHVGTHLPINVWDGTPDPAATAGLTSESQLSYWITVTNNTGQGNFHNGGVGMSGAILLQYLKEATVDNNTLDNYQHGIQWWGGDANPSRGGSHGNPRWARNLTIQYNHVYNSNAGIWGSMGQDVLVFRNYVENCEDVCLDAEGDVNTRFQENHGRNAGHAVADVFHHATNVVWAWNDLRQDGSKGTLLFHTHNDTQDPGQISIIAHNNILRWTAGAGVGTAGKESAKFVEFSNNTLENTVIDMRPNNSGGLQLRGNSLTFDRSTGGAAAIAAGNNYGPWGAPATPVNAGWELEIGGNSISSSASQGWATGIFVQQPAGGAIDTWIYGNTIRDFYPSVGYSRSGTDKYFLIEGNNHSAPLPAQTTNVIVRNNPWSYPLTPTPGDPSNPGGGCGSQRIC